ncbi:hypothetical protein EST38_g5706 [Candolleomyces aberdarensis]|uniref:Nephrocystin 3-like N-terminal domain-containing protein n=1 Tax=Candolleomyces aberdarensis TaxID=2316362 RepID=A0A4Q2DJR5_9AGAR|nr:hypothetical protein EST38_g5706 [Candolleomyces aberdarensis]
MTVTTSSAQELTGKPVEATVGSSPAATSSRQSAAKDALKVTLNFTQTLMKKLPEIVDGNPVKMALGLVKVIIQIKDAVKDNMDAIERRIASTGAQLAIVEKALADPRTYDEGNQWMKQFKTTLEHEINKLLRLSEEWMIRKVADHEKEKGEIAEIFERVNEARVQFELGTGIAVFKIVNALQNDLRRSLGKDLQVSRIADHKYHLRAQEQEKLRREVCVPGTRVRILKNIVKWANNTSPQSQSIYWLFGPAGSGKSSITYTIARRFEITGDVDDTTTLGGNFFCSRQFDEARGVKYIVRTIAYHLALKCKEFADCLQRCETFDVIHEGPHTQLTQLLVRPWVESQSVLTSSTSPCYLIVIDALDEVEGHSGSEFLRALLDVINEYDMAGLKFFVTSRSDPDLVDYVEGFERKQLYRLQDVEKEEVKADIRTYLEANLPRFKGQSELARILEFAGGLFICAATIVRHLTRYKPVEQKRILSRILPGSVASPYSQQPSKATLLLDTLYLQILSDAFWDLENNELSTRLQILHTALCTAEPVSASTVTKLVCDDSDQTDLMFSSTEVAEDVLMQLHAVLYLDNQGNIFSYHKSFSDFIFDQHRLKEYWCNSGVHHRALTQSCFRVMNSGLRFNIADIPSSFILDTDDKELPGRVKQNIPPALSYSSRNWGHHLSVMSSTTSSPDPVSEILANFLQLHALFWIEAMNLLKVSGQCDPMLQVAKKWATNVSFVSQNP